DIVALEPREGCGVTTIDPRTSYVPGTARGPSLTRRRTLDTLELHPTPVHQLELRRAGARIAESVDEVVPVGRASRRELEEDVRRHPDAGGDLRLRRVIVGDAATTGEGGEVGEHDR